MLKVRLCHLRERGMSLVDVLIGTTLLAVVVVGSTYFFTSSKLSLSSSSQDSKCVSIANKAIERVASLGTSPLWL